MEGERCPSPMPFCGHFDVIFNLQSKRKVDDGEALERVKESRQTEGEVVHCSISIFSAPAMLLLVHRSVDW